MGKKQTLTLENEDMFDQIAEIFLSFCRCVSSCYNAALHVSHQSVDVRFPEAFFIPICIISYITHILTQFVQYLFLRIII